MVFESGEALRAEAEVRFGRKLTEEEWATVDAQGSYALPASFDEVDLEELLASMRERFPPEFLPPADRVRFRARDRVSLEADEIRALVEEERRALFGREAPPFNSGADVAEWIEAQPQASERMRVTLELEVSSQDMDLQVVRDVRDWIDRSLEAIGPSGTFTDFLRTAEGLKTLGAGNAALPYLPADAADREEVGIRRVFAPPGTVLEQLLAAAQRVESATGWQLVACVHHLLTGGLMIAPLEATAHVSVVRGAPARETLRLDIRDSSHVDAETVATTYVRARSQLPSGRSRSRRGRGSDRLVAFVERHDDLSWREKLDLWNREHGDSLYPTTGALRAAYRRGRRRR